MFYNNRVLLSVGIHFLLHWMNMCLTQWFPAGMPWRGARSAVSYCISLKFWPIFYLAVTQNTEITHYRCRETKRLGNTGLTCQKNWQIGVHFTLTKADFCILNEFVYKMSKIIYKLGTRNSEAFITHTTFLNKTSIKVDESGLKMYNFNQNKNSIFLSQCKYCLFDERLKLRLVATSPFQYFQRQCNTFSK